MKTLFLTVLFWACCQVGFPQDGNEGIRFLEGMDWTEVLRMAREQGRPVFMDCYTSWCGPCRGLARNVFTRKEVGDFFNTRFINVKYDMEKGTGRMLKEKYDGYIIGYPTLLLIDCDGKVLHRMAGYHEADELIRSMEKALSGKTLDVLESRYRAGEREFSFIRDYVGLLNDAFLKDRAEQVLVDYMKGMPLEKLKEKEVWELLSPVIKDPYSPQFGFVVDNMDYFHRKLGTDRYALERTLDWQIGKEVKRLAGVEADKATGKLYLAPDPRKVAAIRQLLDRVNFKNAGEYRARLRIAELMHAGEWTSVFNHLEVFMDAGILRSVHGMFIENVLEYAAVGCRDRKLLRRGTVWLEKLQEYESSRGKGLEGSYHGTLSRLYTRLGDRRKAEEHRKADEEIQKRKMEKYKDFMDNKK